MRFKNQKKAVIGMKARAEGLGFESFLVNSFRSQNYRVIHLPQGAKYVHHKWKGLILSPVKMPFDMIVSCVGKAGFFDAKSVSDQNFPFSMITSHQVEFMLDLEADGHKAGYIVHFKESNNVIFFTATQLNSLKRRQSLKQDEGVLLGTWFQLNLKGFM